MRITWCIGLLMGACVQGAVSFNDMGSSWGNGAGSFLASGPRYVTSVDGNSPSSNPAYWDTFTTGITGLYGFGFANANAAPTPANYALTGLDVATATDTTLLLNFTKNSSDKVIWVACTGRATAVTYTDAGTSFTLTVKIQAATVSSASDPVGGVPAFGVLIATNAISGADITAANQNFAAADGSLFTVFETNLYWGDLSPAPDTVLSGFSGVALKVAGSDGKTATMSATIPVAFLGERTPDALNSAYDVSGSCGGAVPVGMAFTYDDTVSSLNGCAVYKYLATNSVWDTAKSLQFGSGAAVSLFGTALMGSSNLHQYGAGKLILTGGAGAYTGTLDVHNAAGSIHFTQNVDYSGATLTGPGTAICDGEGCGGACTCKFGIIQ